MRNYVSSNSPDTQWINIGSITASSTALTAAGRASAVAEATGSTKVVSWTFAGGGGSVPKAMLLRFRTDGTEDQTNVVDMLAERGIDSYQRLGTLTITQGQQLASTGIYFSDTITPANEDALFDGEESNIANYIAEYYVRTLGFNRFLFQVTTLNATTVYIDMAYLYE